MQVINTQRWMQMYSSNYTVEKYKREIDEGFKDCLGGYIGIRT